MVTPGSRLRLITPTIAVVLDEKDKQVAEILPRGATLEVLEVTSTANGFVSVRWSGRTFQMFSIDLRERGEIVNSASLG